MKTKILLLFSLFLCFTMAQAQDLQEITVEGVTPGILLTAIKSQVADYKTILGLTVKGNIDARDIKIIRDSLLNLTAVNFADANMVAYTGKEGPHFSDVNVVYKANTLPQEAFLGARTSILVSITLPSSLKTIEQYAFSSCVKLEEVIIPESVDSIGDYTFNGCTVLKAIKLPDALKQLNQNTFRKCTSLASVELPDKLEVIGPFALYKCSALTTLEIPTTVKTILSYAFGGTGLTSIEIPSSVDSIGSSVFSSCTKLETAKIQASIKKFGASTFAGCTALKVVELPATLESSLDLSTCIALESIYSYNPVPPTAVSVNAANYANATVYVPKGSLQAYKDADVWKDFTNIVEMGVITTVGDASNNPVSLSVYPNPVVSDVVTVTLPEADNNAIIRITSLTGKTVLQQSVSKGSTQARIDVSSFGKGIYLVNYSDDAVKNSTVKLIK